MIERQSAHRAHGAASPAELAVRLHERDDRVLAVRAEVMHRAEAGEAAADDDDASRWFSPRVVVGR